MTKREEAIRFLKRMLCKHTHGKLLHITWDGFAVYKCVECGKHIKKGR